MVLTMRLVLTLPSFPRELKAGSASGALDKFNRALAAGVGLRSNLLCGVLNECAKAGWMDDCMRVCSEMKGGLYY